jgi:hypothetical protein
MAISTPGLTLVTQCFKLEADRFYAKAKRANSKSTSLIFSSEAAGQPNSRHCYLEKRQQLAACALQFRLVMKISGSFIS